MKRLAVLAAALLTLTACGPENHDPRDGRVVIERSNCLTGACYIIWKACLGPDLVYYNSDLDSRRVIKESPACEVDQ